MQRKEKTGLVDFSDLFTVNESTPNPSASDLDIFAAPVASNTTAAGDFADLLTATQPSQPAAELDLFTANNTATAEDKTDLSIAERPAQPAVELNLSAANNTVATGDFADLLTAEKSSQPAVELDLFAASAITPATTTTTPEESKGLSTAERSSELVREYDIFTARDTIHVKQSGDQSISIQATIPDSVADVLAMFSQQPKPQASASACSSANITARLEIAERPTSGDIVAASPEQAVKDLVALINANFRQKDHIDVTNLFKLCGIGLKEKDKPGFLEFFKQECFKLVAGQRQRLETHFEYEVSKEEKHNVKKQRRACLDELKQRLHDWRQWREAMPHLKFDAMYALFLEAVKLGASHQEVCLISVPPSYFMHFIQDKSQNDLTSLFLKLEITFLDARASRRYVLDADEKSIDPKTYTILKGKKGYSQHLHEAMLEHDLRLSDLFEKIYDLDQRAFGTAMKLIPEQDAGLYNHITKIAYAAKDSREQEAKKQRHLQAKADKSGLAGAFVAPRRSFN